MARAEEFRRWELQEADLVGLTPIRVRDLFIECFFRAHKEMFARVKKKLGSESQPPEVSDEALAEMVSEAVSLAFEEAGEDFDRPTKGGLSQVLDVLTKKAIGWGTPRDIVAHHKQQLLAVLSRLD
jgi:hypothetical protein